MGLLDILGGYKKRRSEQYALMSEQISNWTNFMTSLLETDGLIQRSSYYEQLKTIKEISAEAEKLNKKLIFFPDGTISTFRIQYAAFQEKLNSFESEIDAHNTVVLSELILEARNIVGTVEGHELDDQQMMCIVKDAHNHNVVAGAGTGKTTTIIGKVKYLIGSGKVKPGEILVLSYTRAAASEMRERLKRNTSYDIAVSTFHRFGYYILTEVEGKKPLIFSKSPRELLKTELSRLTGTAEYSRKLIRYLGNGAGLDRSDMDPSFESVEDYQLYVNEHRPVTLKGETVKSYGELHVANILAANGVRYEYERRYEYDTATQEHAQYYPDFYLPDYQIYIEFFGINRNGEVPEWFEGEDPTRTYQEGMRWKRKTHKQYGTKLIECYAYEDFDGILQESLEKKLTDAGVELKPVSLGELLQGTGNSAENVLNAFLSCAESVINLARNRMISPEDLLPTAGSDAHARLTAELVYPLQKAYENYLSSTKQIDFADMLNRAAQYVLEGKYSNPFRCIIVDEYQDVTASQYRLLKALRQGNDFDLFCVGDDWQSIYRFNGSDVSYIMDFEDFWGVSELSRIETTYRFLPSLIDVSGSFIMKNPRQIKKTIRSGKDSSAFVLSKIEGYTTETAIRFMTDRLLCLPEKSSVYLLGRYNFDIKMLEKESRLSVQFDTASQTQKIILKGRPDLDITFYTVHRSKGLQADYVVILNNLHGTLGFPSKVEDNALTDLLLEHSDSYPFAEERRLFYVALTRTRRCVYLLTVKGKESSFEKELEGQYGSRIRNETYICPKCGGRLRIIEGRNGKFFGCENYREQHCTYTSPVS